MQTQGVQERRQSLHQHQDTDGEDCPKDENYVQFYTATKAVALQTNLKDHVPQYFRQLYKKTKICILVFFL